MKSGLTNPLRFHRSTPKSRVIAPCGSSRIQVKPRCSRIMLTPIREGGNFKNQRVQMLARELDEGTALSSPRPFMSGRSSLTRCNLMLNRLRMSRKLWMRINSPWLFQTRRCKSQSTHKVQTSRICLTRTLRKRSHSCSLRSPL